MDFWRFCSGDYGKSGSYVLVAWTWIQDLGVEMWFLLALRKGCLLLMPSTKCLLHMQQPPLVNGHCCDINCSRMGHFGSAVQHLVVARGWGFCWGGATAASLWNVLILSPTCSPIFVSLLLSPVSSFYPKLHFPSGDLGPSTFEKKWCFLWFYFIFFQLLFLFAQLLCRNAWWGNGRSIRFQFCSLLFCGPIPAGV